MITIGNCSGFYGDRFSAMRDMLEGGRLDVLTGDYLAELTMLILGKDTLKDPTTGYAKTFLRQVADSVDLALQRDVKIVSNAGGLNPAGLAAAIEALGTRAKVAYVDGDDLRGRLDSHPDALTANAYLGAFGIAHALDAGADIVVTGRVTDASVVVGPAIAHHGWKRDSYDELAGAVVAGHVIECGTQATGGNFSGFLTMSPQARARPLGFPVAEIAVDGSSIITKQDETGGTVTVDTVTAQLLYEIQGPLYLGPDVTTDLTSIRLQEVGIDRVAITGVTGTPPPATLKVAVNSLGGYRNSAEFVLTGPDIDAKAAWLRDQLDAELPIGPDYTWSTYRIPAPDSPTEEGAACILRLSARAADADAVGRALTAPAIELALASYPGFHVTAPPGRPSPFGIYKAAYVRRDRAPETVHLPDGSTYEVPSPLAYAEASRTSAETSRTSAETSRASAETSRASTGVTSRTTGATPRPTGATPRPTGATSRRELGELVYARSGDKGGDANLGLWVPQGRPEASVEWLLDTVTPQWVRELLPEAEDLAIDITPLPHLRGVNIVIHDLLGEGVAASTRFDPQAKGLGEWARSRFVDMPLNLCPDGTSEAIR
ncbi:acyclic terpene utilization AtuA family protein [Nocardioides sp. NPDC058538]|uniref:acyclic terpene utilization AtuA family protein n=1 Tax=Nocardioides sp. NPDC058538 TaxID=3346542 RepID=UPI003658242C